MFDFCGHALSNTVHVPAHAQDYSQTLLIQCLCISECSKTRSDSLLPTVCIDPLTPCNSGYGIQRNFVNSCSSKCLSFKSTRMVALLYKEDYVNFMSFPISTYSFATQASVVYMSLRLLRAITRGNFISSPGVDGGVNGLRIQVSVNFAAFSFNSFSFAELHDFLTCWSAVLQKRGPIGNARIMKWQRRETVTN